jgi:dynein heavy chain 2
MREYPISCFIAAAFTTFLCDKDENQREVLVSEWKTRTKMSNFNFLKFMITESIQLKWRSLGLASDSLSIENSVMIFSTNKVPLLMDPNNQAI